MCISESCNKIQINLNLYFHTTLRCLKGFMKIFTKNALDCYLAAFPLKRNFYFKSSNNNEYLFLTFFFNTFHCSTVLVNQGGTQLRSGTH